MTRVELIRASRLINFSFKPPFFESNGVEGQFFDMVYHSLSHIIPISVQDFSAVARTNLSDPFAKYDFVGGPCTTTLSADILSADFPNQGPEDVDIILRILDALNSGFQKTFPEQVFTNIQVIASGHVLILDPGGAQSYLNRFVMPTASDVEGMVYLPGARFGLQDPNGVWRTRCTVELSDVLDNGVFFMLDTDLVKITDDSFSSKWAVYNDMFVACMKVLGMETNGV